MLHSKNRYTYDVDEIKEFAKEVGVRVAIMLV